MRHSNVLALPYFQREVVRLEAQSEPVQFLGRTYLPADGKEFTARFQSTNWFCYRKNIEGVGEDSGWGCTIRTAQMLLAHVVRETLGLSAVEAIDFFRDRQDAVFSLSSICKRGHISTFATMQSDAGADPRRWCTCASRSPRTTRSWASRS